MEHFIHNTRNQNYYFMKGLAYTEDHIPVQQLYLYKISPELAQPQIFNYFRRYGRVIRVQIFSKHQSFSQPGRKPGPKTQTGFVLFALARDAAKALRRRHNINGLNLFARASDSWHQPQAYHPNMQRRPIAVLPNSNGEEPTQIFRLNDYCMEYVLRYLSLVDQVRFARTCVRFNAVYNAMSCVVHKSVDFSNFDGMTAWDMRDFFSQSGSHVQKLEGVMPEQNRERMLDLISQHCRNLKVLNMYSTELTTENLYKMFRKLTHLESLKMCGCDIKNVLPLKNLKCLKVLDLSDNEELKGSNLNCLPASIESVKLSGCERIEPMHLARLCNALPHLKSLDVRQIELNTNAFKSMVTGCKALEDFTMSHCSGKYDLIAKFPSLKKLIIHFWPTVTEFRSLLFSQLIEHKADQLEHLEMRGCRSLNTNDMAANIAKLTALRTLILPFNSIIADELQKFSQLKKLQHLNIMNSSNASDSVIMRLIIACPELRVLNVEGCKKITKKLVDEVIEKVGLQIKNKDSQRQLPIKLYAYQTEISEFLLQEPKYSDAKKILDICFKPSEPDYTVEDCLSSMFHIHAEGFHRAGFVLDSDDDLEFVHDPYLFDIGFDPDDDDDDYNNRFNRLLMREIYEELFNDDNEFDDLSTDEGEDWFL
ncbi:uncharacterized protein LOC115634709 [Scaptodrosophila lebanonensis]|uniref:Uncharacterized protein LOC115634709 n=1 Tax=Drosophila lebanonensis TaxID=7225 RepID=A0A6J2UJ89_DROLE|nr:uncharacterized protein LOC115634709 [Scaptodrosophila lebanonensis]XP_030388461.1 uncharacterized protein LOC115634709 [Scaptodrosophila lebanonensis]